MSNQRRNKRKSQRLATDLQAKFTKVSEGFVSDFLNGQAEGLDEDQLTVIFEKYEAEWRAYTRWKISKFPELVRNEKKRMNVLNRFTNFVDKFLDRKQEMDVLSTEKMGIEKMREALKEVGVITQAKTVKGVQKRVNELGEEDKAKLLQVLS